MTQRVSVWCFASYRMTVARCMRSNTNTHPNPLTHTCAPYCYDFYSVVKRPARLLFEAYHRSVCNSVEFLRVTLYCGGHFVISCIRHSSHSIHIARSGHHCALRLQSKPSVISIRSSERDKQRRKDTDKARQSVKRPLSPIVHVFWFCSWSTALSNSNIGLAVPVAVSGDLISSASHIIKLGKTDFFLLNRSIQALRIDAATTNRRRKYVWFIFESSRFVRGTGRLGDF